MRGAEVVFGERGVEVLNGILAAEETPGQRSPGDTGLIVFIADRQYRRRVVDHIEIVLDRGAVFTLGE